MPGNVRAILDLVETVHLPSEGIAEAMEYFWVARAGEHIVGTVGLEVYDIGGRRVSHRDLGLREAGSQQALFNARGMPSGLYFYRLRTPTFTSQKKLTVLRR